VFLIAQLIYLTTVSSCKIRYVSKRSLITEFKNLIISWLSEDSNRCSSLD
jgi:hypothetical protein